MATKFTPAAARISVYDEPVVYSPLNTSDNSYVILDKSFQPTLPVSSRVLSSEVPSAGAAGGPPKAFLVLLGVVMAAALADLVFNKKLTIHKEIHKSVAGAAAFEGVKAGTGI